MADIIRNHIFTGKVYVDDAAQRQGGIFSINRHFVRLGEPVRDDYTLDGQDIAGGAAFDGNTLYTLNGVIASKHELAMLSQLRYSSTTHVISSTVTQHTIPDPACGTAGCPGSYTKTTIIEEPATAVTPGDDSESP